MTGPDRALGAKLTGSETKCSKNHRLANPRIGATKQRGLVRRLVGVVGDESATRVLLDIFEFVLIMIYLPIQVGKEIGQIPCPSSDRTVYPTSSRHAISGLLNLLLGTARFGLAGISLSRLHDPLANTPDHPRRNILDSAYAGGNSNIFKKS
ncbi:hypothetical protein C8R44DRAFT_751088 [Mycena epipterygia]|nr:hypothetical protein C8R44DRAFT_751088 [Mycena epipterygia]